MIKLRKLSISGFRGVRFTLPLDFTKDNRSVSVHGDNASGKSTLTDALEWLIHGKVDHLWREDCNEESLRNVLLGAKDVSSVGIEFSNSVSNVKRLNPDFSVAETNKDKSYREFLIGIRKENIFLRHADITDFIQKTKSDKRKAIAAIIGYESISSFRDLIQGSLNSLEKDKQYIAAKQLTEDQKKKSLELAGKFITSPQSLYEQMNADIEKQGFSIKVKDKDTYDAAIGELRAKINQEERLEKRLALDELIKDITALQNKIPIFKDRSIFISGYNALVQEKAAIAQIRLQHFLSSGIKILDEGHAEDSKCPFCLTNYDLAKLRSEVDLRLGAISHITEQLSEIESSANSMLSVATEIKALCDKFGSGYSALEKHKQFCGLAKATGDFLEKFRDEAAKNVGLRQALEVPDAMLLKFDALIKQAAAHLEMATAEVASLHFTEYEAKVITLIEHLGELQRTYDTYASNSKIVTAFEKQILTLGNIFDRFVKTQNAALQTVLDEISKDVGTFYKFLHPNESVDSVSLKITGEEGIEFEYLFHGKPAHPPMKYLSESHLNSLGVVLFLASARLFNQTTRFLVLDDIVTSFDFNHRRRLLRLLKEEFADWQIILLTHEPFWFEMIKKELGPEGWLAFDVTADDENGTSFSQSPKDLRALIEIKRKHSDVSNDLRKLLEATLKEICYKLGVKLAFQYNDENERRMIGELLSELRSTVNRKCPQLKSDPIFANLAGSNLVVNTGSHDNQEKISGGDIDVALGDIDKLQSLFKCPKCNGLVDEQFALAGSDTITCRCGEQKLEWKQ